MKIVLLNPPFLPKYSRFSRSPAVTKSATIYYPIWHAYAAGYLENKGHEVKLLDACAESLTEEDCLRVIKEFSPGLVALYTSTPSIYNDMAIGGRVKDKCPDAFVVMTGPHVSALPRESLELDKRVDAIARREYELTLNELAGKLEKGQDISGVAGLTLRNQGRLVANPDQPYIEDLDALPFVSATYKKHLRIKNYFYAHCRYPLVSIFTSRGCFAKCNFCVYPQQMFGRRQRQRSPENIVEEFLYIQKELPQAKEVLIDDDTFSFNQTHTRKFCELMIKKQITIPWTVECRANLEYETMLLMKKAGCRLIVTGFESADETILKNIHKGISLSRMEKFVSEAKKAGVMIHACFMVGNKGESLQSMKKSLDFAIKTGADTCQFYPLMVYPGTEAYEWVNKNGYLKTKDFRSWLTIDGLHNCVFDLPNLCAADLVGFCDYARRKYYISFRYILYKLWRIVRSPGEIKKTLIAFRTFFGHLTKRKQTGRKF